MSEVQARSLFLDALEKPADHRPSFVRDACLGNAELRARVEQLLQAHEAMGGIQERSSKSVSDVDALCDEGPGTVIGSYELLEQIGEGGFGVVFMAEQTKPVRRKVALKVLKAGMDTRHVVARFEAERQALAIMDHPNIAKVFDGGATPSGRPYFVMELVRGMPITDFCDQHQMTPRQRLELFVPACQAVQHAHNKGIIHRDLKPSNVLVTMHDTTPVVKVIDFGVAKALGQELTDKTLFTGFIQMVGTPLYMSPEQAGQSGLDIDTRSDIYSLGVLLYELLAGTTPFDKDRFKQAAYDEICRIIREEEPPKPSTRLSASKEALPSISAQRQTEPGKLPNIIRGELDWIVMKNLEKDRNRRYETANGLALDVQRYLTDEPVQACPPSVWYRLRKFIHRNRAASFAMGVVAAVLIVATAFSSWQAARAYQASLAEKQASEKRDMALVDAQESARRAQKQLERAEKNSAHVFTAVSEMLTTVADDSLTRFPEMQATRRGLLEQAVRMYQRFIQESDSDPSARFETARAYDYLSRIYPFLGQEREAEQANQKAFKMLEQLVEEFRTEQNYRAKLADVHRWRGQYFKKEKPEQAIRHFRSDVQLCEQLALEDPARFNSSLADAYWALAYFQMLAGPQHHQEAEQLFRKAIKLQEALCESGKLGPLSLANSFNSLGILLRLAKRPAEAEVMHRRALEYCDRVIGGSVPSSYSDPRFERARSQNHLAYSLWAQGRSDDAIRHATEGVAIFKETTKEFPLNQAYLAELVPTCHSLGKMLERAGRRREAGDSYRQALTFAEQLSPGNPHSAGADREMIGILFTLVRFKLEGGPTPEECFRRLRELRPKDRDLQNTLAWHLATFPDPNLRDVARAAELAKNATDQAPTEGGFWNTLGVAQYRLGEWKLAVATLTKSMGMRQGGDAFDWFFLAMANWQLGNKDDARMWYDRAVEWMDRNQPKNEELRRFRDEADGLIRKETK